CDAVSLSPKVPPGWTPPGGARGYVVKRAKIDLFTGSRGDLVTTLSHAADAKILFWGGDTADGFVHVEYDGDLAVDAWARLQDLAPLAPGETMDQLIPAGSQPGAARVVQLQGRAKIVRASSAVLIRAAATDAAVVIGGVDAGVE